VSILCLASMIFQSQCFLLLKPFIKLSMASLTFLISDPINLCC